MSLRFLFIFAFLAVPGRAQTKAQAKVCYQGRASVWDASSGRWHSARVALDWNGGSGEYVNRLKISGSGFTIDSTLFCGGQAPAFQCGLEDDGGGAKLNFAGKQVILTPIGRLQIARDDSGALDRVEVLSAHRDSKPMRLTPISARLCRQLFPHSDRIIIPNPPRY